MADAIDLYLKCQRAKHQVTAVGAEQTERECPSVPADKETPRQDTNNDDEDEDEWFDPADYDEELAAEGVAGPSIVDVDEVITQESPTLSLNSPSGQFRPFLLGGRPPSKSFSVPDSGIVKESIYYN